MGGLGRQMPGVDVGATVAVGVNVGVDVSVGVAVRVGVAVGVDVCVGVAVGATAPNSNAPVSQMSESF